MTTAVLPEIPWSIALRLFRYQLIKRLMDGHGMSRTETIAFLDAHLNKSNDLIQGVLDDLTRDIQADTESKIDSLFKERMSNH